MVNETNQVSFVPSTGDSSRAPAIFWGVPGMFDHIIYIYNIHIIYFKVCIASDHIRYKKKEFFPNTKAFALQQNFDQDF